MFFFAVTVIGGALYADGWAELMARKAFNIESSGASKYFVIACVQW